MEKFGGCRFAQSPTRRHATQTTAKPSYGGVGVGVATRKTICAVGPRLPAVSRSCTVRIDSPGGNNEVAEMKSQNWMRAAVLMKCVSPEASVNVQAFCPVVATLNRHAKSSSALVIV